MRAGPTIDISYVLDKIYYGARDERHKGDGFERLVRTFLLTEPVHANRFDQVWLWNDWPDRASRPDRGIDLVARERETGDLVAVQCKFYDPAHHLNKADIDSFLSESGKHPFRSRLVVSTTDDWGPAAEAAVADQQIPVSRIGLNDLVESTVDWTQFDIATPEVLATKGRKQLRPHQRTALERVRAGFETHDRGQLIMACGTGKTFTSLRIAEDLVPLGGRVLFLVPSIALLSQALKEWSTEAEASLRTFAVCSDTKVGRSSEDISVVDLAIPATTDAGALAERAGSAAEGRLTVVFATYQSIDVVARAQQAGLPGFDLVICDEAHRTTGAKLADEDASAFQRVHDADYLATVRRLYMTATPRLYDDASKAKAGQTNAVLASMDDESTYGPVFHRLGFGEAVSAGLLTDYKVVVLTVDEGAVASTFQQDLATNSELNLPDLARMVGCWNALSKRMADDSFAGDPTPMRTAVAFARDIKTSRRFAETFEQVAATYLETMRMAEDAPSEDPLAVHVKHVDGTMNMLRRGELMDWLKSPGGEGPEARILSNAKCLSEGVDVPALDAVVFLNPRKSVVDVVQSVGRVMRLAPGKQYGYIILPIAIPAGTTPEAALADNERFRVVWEVLQALRAHDERFDAIVNKIELNNHKPAEIIIGGWPGDEGDGDSLARPIQPELPLQAVTDWREAIYAKLVTKVGSRRYWESWAKDVARIVEAHTARLRATIENPATPELAEKFEEFVAALRANLNDSITPDAAIDMLSQHLVTRPVFDALFPGYAFTEHNPVATVMQTMLRSLEGSHLGAETEALEGFYSSVRMRAAGIDNAAGKQKVIAELYEKFFKLAFPRMVDSLGIVYTPVEIVDFILRSVNDLLVTEFGTTISAPGVHVLDPFTGTGTFITRLLASGLIQPEDLARKYAEELHANEITLLAYYIAAANIEATYRELTAGFDAEQLPDGAASASAEASPSEWVPFGGIVLADTFQMTEHEDTLDQGFFASNSERAERQLGLDIQVIVGNPPYSVGQSAENDNNKNLAYPSLDRRIAESFVSRSSEKSHRSLYDSYVRAIRWASDRIGDSGVVGFVTNGGFIDSNTADGLRKSLLGEFAAVYIYNLRGNQRTAGDLSRREGGKIFGAGSRNTVAITFLVKKPDGGAPAILRYRDIGDYLTREEKLEIVGADHLGSIEWRTIAPNEAGDWINQRSRTFDAFPPLAASTGGDPVFRVQSLGLTTNRDAWVYAASPALVVKNVERLVETFNHSLHLSAADVPSDPTLISWSRSLSRARLAGTRASVDPDRVAVAAYRPFQKRYVYFDRLLNEDVRQFPRIFPRPSLTNRGFYVVGTGSDKPFSVHATDAITDLAYWGSSNGQYFPRYTYRSIDSADAQGAFDLSGDETVVIDGYMRFDNIPDHTLSQYRNWYGSEMTKDDIFAFVYGFLHSLDYRERFAADLKRSLPRIPRIESEDFPLFRDAGQRLLDLHIGYEDVDPYPLTVEGADPAQGADPYEHFRVSKLTWTGKGKKKDRSSIIYNPRVTVTGIPEEAHEYMLGSRSALEWILDRYQVKTDKPSGIVNDPNDYSREVGNPRYILDLIGKVTNVSVETVGVVEALPPLRIVAE